MKEDITQIQATKNGAWAYLAFGITVMSVVTGVTVLRASPWISAGRLAGFGIASLITLIAMDWPWQRASVLKLVAVFRFALLGMLTLWLQLALLGDRATRQALATAYPVGENLPDVSPFASGVHTMAREIGAGIGEAWLPIILLLWLGASASFRAILSPRKAE